MVEKCWENEGKTGDLMKISLDLFGFYGMSWGISWGNLMMI
jgi:hypothetical protein